MAIIYKKSEKGLREIATRENRLAPRYRSALITVDGVKSDDMLASTWNLLGDGEEILTHLVTNGFVEVHQAVEKKPRVEVPQAEVSKVSDVSKTQPIPKAGDAAKRIADCKIAASRFLNDSLGPNAESLARAIEKANNLTALSAAIERARSVLEDFKGKDVAARFVAEVSKHLSN
jgi:hypothetical protein